jgi:uncharacterized protein (DUF58 family)
MSQFQKPASDSWWPGFLPRFERAAWIRFFVGLAGLALAFIAAMYSTVFRESGNLIGTAVSASLALLMAGFVGLYTVPYLMKRVALERVREAFDYDITKEGVAYLAIALVIGVAGLNTGNNLLFVVLAAMLAGIIVSGFASAVTLNGLDVDLTLPGHVFARQAVRTRLNLRNSFPLASFSVSVVPPKPKSRRKFIWKRGLFAFPPGRAPEKQWLRLPDLRLEAVGPAVSPDAIFRSSIYFPFISARSVAHADVDLEFPRRGFFVQDGFSLATRFPFSFLLKTRTVPLNRELVVYPSVEPTDEFFQVLPMITGEFEVFMRGRGFELYRIREHMPEDSARLVDWKATAKSGSLKVREFTREDERKLRIIFDNPAPGTVSHEDYESAVALTASLAWHFSELRTQLTFVAPGYHQSSGQAEGIFDFLKYLALVQPAVNETENALQNLRKSPDYNIVVTAQPRGSLPTNLWASSYIIFMRAEAKPSHGTVQVEKDFAELNSPS